MQQFFLVVLAMSLVAPGSGMFSLDELVKSHADSLAHLDDADGSLKAVTDAAHERVKLQLVELENSHSEHLAAHEDAQAMLAKLDSQHGLADLKYFLEDDRLALQATNDADRAEVKAKLAAMDASNSSSSDAQSLRESHEEELARLDARHEVFVSFAAQAQAAAAKEQAQACAKEHLVKIHELQKKAATAPKSVRGTTAKHILHKDPAFLQAMAEDITVDTKSAVHLAQTRATIIPGRKRVRGGGDYNFAVLAAIGAFAVTYLSVSQGGVKDSKVA